MANCEENKAATYMQRGSYGYVSKVEGTVACEEFRQGDTQIQATRSFFGQLFNRGVKAAADVSIMLAISIFTHNVLIHHQLGDPDVSRLDRYSAPDTFDSRLLVAQYFGNVVDIYRDIERDIIKDGPVGAEKPPYTLGLSLSDAVEVLPTSVSARVLLAVSDPDVARTVFMAPRRKSDEQRVDPQPHAVEVISLLPNEARHKIFEEMARLSPGRSGDARRLLSLVASNWANYNSPFCGREAIYRNLQGEQAGEKVLEVQDDLLFLGQLIEKVGI